MVTLKHIATDFGEAADVALAYERELARTFGGWHLGRSAS